MFAFSACDIATFATDAPDTAPCSSTNRCQHLPRTPSRYLGAGSSSASPLDNASPAAILISTGKIVPLSNISCTRTLPLVCEAETPAARQSSAAGGAPGASSLLSNSAIATAGANSLAMATLVADFLVCFRAAAGVVARLGFLLAEVGDLTLGAADARSVVFEVRMVGDDRAGAATLRASLGVSQASVLLSPPRR